MKSGRKSRAGPGEKLEFWGEKLNRIRKRWGHSTPVVPFWRLQLQLQSQALLAATTASNHHQGAGSLDGGQHSIIKESPFQFPAVSARKLAATLWELHHYRLPLFMMMNQGIKGQPHGQRRLQHRRRRFLLEDNGGLEHPDPSPSSPDMPESASSLRRQVALLMQHQRPTERNNRAIQPVSSASYGSSLEVAPYNPAVTPTSSIGFNGRVGETSYSLKTSTELLKVLNRIWSLEEQHSSNILLVKGLKKELDKAHGQIRDLLRDQRADRQEIDKLMRQIAEDKLARKNKEQDRINSAVQSAQDQLEDERKLRKRSESLHRKLAREHNELKITHAAALKEIDLQKKNSVLLEDLCDEFARGIGDCEQELHALRQKCNKEWADRANQDRLMLHMSESWLDVRAQMRLESQQDLVHSASVVDKLREEMQAFIQAKHNSNTSTMRDYDYLKSFSESTPLNVGVSAPLGDNDGEDSTGSDSHCFELQKPGGVDMICSKNNVVKNDRNETKEPNQTKKQVVSAEKRRSRSPSSLQVSLEEQMAQAMLHSEAKSQAENVEQETARDLNPEEISVSKATKICDAGEEEVSVRRNRPNGNAGSNFNTIDSLIRSHYRLSESVTMPPGHGQGLALSGNSAFRNRGSPVRQWTEKLPSSELEVSESSSKLPADLRENTLKAKLIEARTRGHRSRSRLKGIKVPF